MSYSNNLKILLIQPPVQDFYDTDIRLQPLGLCFLKAILIEKIPGIEVHVRDFHNAWNRKTIPLPAAFKYLKEYYSFNNQSPFSTFNQYYHFGASFAEIAAEVEKEAPDIVGISSLFTPYYREVLKCASAIKERIQTIIVVGGGHPTCCPDVILKDRNVDFIIRGEGERPLVELVHALQNDCKFEGIKGLGYKNNNEFIINDIGENFSFDDLPIPDFADLDPQKYLYRKQPIAFIQTSRGCPHKCTFCSVNMLFGRVYRKRSIGKIIQEIKIRFTQGYRVFDFEDDNLTYNRNEIIKLSRLIAKEFGSQDITLLAMNGVSYQSLDNEVLENMFRAGFKRLNLALVSAEPKTLRSIQRAHSVEKLIEVIAFASNIGFDLEVHMIIGLPGDTIENMINTMILLAGLPVLIGVSIFYLTPGTKAAEGFPMMDHDDLFKSRSTAMAITSSSCSREDLYTLFITARIINFIKGLANIVGRTSFEQLISAPDVFEGRESMGLKLLFRLLNEQKLYAWHKGQGECIEKFNYALFKRVWDKLSHIQTQNKHEVYLG